MLKMCHNTNLYMYLQWMFIVHVYYLMEQVCLTCTPCLLFVWTGLLDLYSMFTIWWNRSVWLVLHVYYLLEQVCLTCTPCLLFVGTGLLELYSMFTICWNRSAWIVLHVYYLLEQVCLNCTPCLFINITICVLYTKIKLHLFRKEFWNFWWLKKELVFIVFWFYMLVLFCVRVRVCNPTSNNISVILWQSVSLVEETGVPGVNNRPVTSHWQTLSYKVVSSTPHHKRDSNLQL